VNLIAQTWVFDLIERIFKVPTSNGLLLSDYVHELSEIHAPIRVFGDKINDLSGMSFEDNIAHTIENYKADPKNRLECIQIQKKWVLDSHTYFHRVADIFNLLQMEEQAVDTLNKYNELRKKSGF
jgi:hypothetical protein